jgi:ketosteroid isomerase-like protein
MSSNHQIAADAFAAWSAGTGYVTSIFAPDMRWEIVGRSAVSKRYDSTQQFLDEVLHPFGARFSAGSPFRPVNIRAIYADDEQRTVAVVWDGEGTAARLGRPATPVDGAPVRPGRWPTEAGAGRPAGLAGRRDPQRAARALRRAVPAAPRAPWLPTDPAGPRRT